MIKRRMILIAWIVFAILFWNTYSVISEPTIAPEFDRNAMNIEQQELFDGFVKANEKRNSNIRIAEIVDGEKLYIFSETRHTNTKPIGFDDPSEMAEWQLENLADLGLVQKPSWVFLKKEISFVKLEDLKQVLRVSLVLGVAVGLFFGFKPELLLSLIVGWALGLVLAIPIGLEDGWVLGSIYYLVFSLTFGLICGLTFLTYTHWKPPPDPLPSG